MPTLLKELFQGRASICLAGELKVYAVGGSIFVVTCILVVGILVFLNWILDIRRKELESARVAYRESLSQLERDPTNTDLRARTLSLGRRYSALTRQQAGNGRRVTVYDEVAIANDIGAACAAAAIVRLETAERREATVGVVQAPGDRLTRLKDLHDQGLITEAEYHDRRERILDEL